MKMVFRMLSILGVLGSLLAGCVSITRTPENGVAIDGWGPHMFHLGEDADMEVERIVKQMIDFLEKGDCDSIKELFSANTINSCEMLDAQIVSLNDFLEGELVSITSPASSSSTSQGDGDRTTVTDVAFDISTTLESYHAAVRFCSIDTIDPDNEGLQSFYIIKASDYDSELCYWGGYIWEPGIVIEGKQSTD